LQNITLEILFLLIFQPKNGCNQTQKKSKIFVLGCSGAKKKFTKKFKSLLKYLEIDFYLF